MIVIIRAIRVIRDFFWLAELLIGSDGQFIAAIIFWMAAVARDAGEFQAVLGDQLIEPLPQLGVGDGLELALLAALPAVALPAGHPFGQALTDIFAVGE